MPNGLQTRVEFKNASKDAQAIVCFLQQINPTTADTGEYAKPIASLIEAGLVDVKPGSASIHLISNASPNRLIVIGTGEKQTVEQFRAAGGALAKLVVKHKIATLALLDSPGMPHIIAGFTLGGFEYTDYKGAATTKKNTPKSTTLRLLGKYSAAQQDEIRRALIIAQSQNYARTIASRPGNDINPPSLAKVARQLATEFKLGITVLDEKKMKQLQMGGMIGVGAGSSATPPRMIVLEYDGPVSKKHRNAPPLLVVGKAITFDTGGISIKPATGMEWMVFDKCGGMAVLGMIRAIALLKLPIRVIGILAAAENHISQTAYRPGDILKMYNGVTAEVISTDAEGRLVLADALAWGIERYSPSAVIDIATLTGGVVVALGKSMAGVMGNDDNLIDQLQTASKSVGEKMWRLPIFDEHRELLKSNHADICNSGPREASPLIGGAFLSHFVPKDLPWAHLDIAGVAWMESAKTYFAKGATGWGVGTLVEWVTARATAK